MEKKFILPASTMLIGIIGWSIFLLIFNSDQITLLQELIVGISIGGLIVFSAVTCRGAGGPRNANIFRTVLLVIMAIITYWVIGVVGGSILVFSALITGLIVLSTKKTEQI